MSDALGSFLVNNKTGTLWSYSLRLSGLPYNWTDGRAAWNDSVYTDERPGGLAEDEFNLEFNFDPKEPLDTGTGQKFKLIDDGTGYLHRAFAPLHGTTTKLTSKVTSSDTTISVMDSSGFSSGEYLYFGSSETVKITAIPDATSLTVTRGEFYTLTRTHNRSDNPSGPVVSNSPRTFKGRYAELWMGAANPLTGVLDSDNTYMVWAGYVSAVSSDATSYVVDAAPITDAIKAFWPNVLADGTLTGLDYTNLPFSTMVYSEDYLLGLTYGNAVGGTSTTTTVTVNVGTYDTTGTFVQTTEADAVLGIPTLLQMLHDTIIFNSSTSIAYNDLTIHWDWLGGNGHVKALNTSNVYIRIDPNIGIGRVLAGMGVGGTIQASDGTVIVSTDLGTTWSSYVGAITASATSIEVLVTNELVPFDASQGLDGKAYAKLEAGGKFEIISFTGVSVNAYNKRRMTLTGIRRGQVATSAQEWTYDDAGSDGVKITQLAAFGSRSASSSYHSYSIPATDVVLNVLTSTGTGTNGSYDTYGDRMGPMIPLRYLYWEGFEAIRDIDMLPVSVFWIDKFGKGGDALAELLRASGLVLVTRRFTRGGQNLFGLSVETITLPTTTTYSDIATDTDRNQKTRPLIDYNERLIVNIVKFSTQLGLGGDKGQGRDMFYYAEDSIAEYGAAEELDLGPAALIGSGTIREAYGAGVGRDEMNFVEAGYVSLRWFGAYSQGNYTLKLDAPFTGWRFQIGDKVSITLTGLIGPDGSEGVTQTVGKVINNSMRHGSRATASVKFRLAYSDLYELAPNCLVTAQTSGVWLAIRGNEYSRANDTAPFALSFATDTDWFDTDNTSANIPVTVWKEGDYTTAETTNIIARVGDLLTVSPALSSSMRGYIGSDRVIMVYGDYTDVTGISPLDQYTYIGDNNQPSSTEKTYA